MRLTILALLLFCSLSWADDEKTIELSEDNIVEACVATFHLVDEVFGQETLVTEIEYWEQNYEIDQDSVTILLYFLRQLHYAGEINTDDLVQATNDCITARKGESK